MHVLFYIHSLSSGGAERVTSVLADHWASRGWKVTVVTTTGCKGDFYTLHQRIERVGLDLDHPSANPVSAVLRNASRMMALRRVLKDRQPDVAVAMMASANAMLAIAGQGLGIPTVGSERIHPPTLPLGRAWEGIRRWSYPKLSALVAQTEQSAAWLYNHAPAPRIAVIPNPVNYPMAVHEPRVSPASIRQETGARHILLAVGRLVEQKAFDRLISAFAAIAPEHPDWALVILGKGRQRDELLQQITDLGVGQRVKLVGAVGNTSEWYGSADLYGITSRFEGFPNTLLEALAHGLPAVAVDCETGPRDILRHQEEGLLVAQNDPQALTTALATLMGDAALRRRFAKKAIEARDRFAVPRVAKMWENVFGEVRV